jgi:purine-binding chemotaxis protein CheW
MSRVDEEIQLAAFFVGSEEYAIDIMRIREILNPAQRSNPLKLVRVPKAPPFVDGVVSLRGAILPIIDMRKRFDAPPPGDLRSTRYIIVSMPVPGAPMRVVGLAVDAVSLIRIKRSEVKPPPEFSGLGGGGSEPYFAGVCSWQGRIIMILNIDRILTTAEKISLGSGSGAAEATDSE